VVRKRGGDASIANGVIGLRVSNLANSATAGGGEKAPLVHVHARGWVENGKVCVSESGG